MVTTTLDSGPAVNKLRWNSSGTQIAVGDNVGRVHLCDVGEVSRVAVSRFSNRWFNCSGAGTWSQRAFSFKRDLAAAKGPNWILDGPELRF